MIEFQKKLIDLCKASNMKHRRTYRIWPLFTALLLLVVACKENPLNHPKYDSELRIALESLPSTFIPFDATDYFSSTVLSQVTEGLISINPNNLSIEPQLAESWTISSDSKSYEFILRKNVLFHESSLFKDEDERRFSSEDVAFSLMQMCRDRAENKPSFAYQFLLKNAIQGARDYHNQVTDSISGIQLTDTSIKISLLEPDANFLNKLSHISLSILSHNIPIERYDGHVVGTGPFQMLNSTNDQSIHLLRNPDYYEFDEEGLRLPYLKKLDFILEKENKKQIDLFLDGKIDLVLDLKKREFSDFIQKYQDRFNTNPPQYVFINNPLFAVNMLGFNASTALLSDVQVRKAIQLSIPKSEILKKSVHIYNKQDNQFGLIPNLDEMLSTYDFSSLKEYQLGYDTLKAQSMLKGRVKGDTTVLRLISNDSNPEDAMLDLLIQRVSKTLGLKIEHKRYPMQEFLDKLYRQDYDLIYLTLYSDYPSPEGLLQYFYGNANPTSKDAASYQNILKYSNATFDFYFDQARKAKKEFVQNSSFLLAEKQLLKDYPFVILSYPSSYQISTYRLKNYFSNPLNYFQAKKIYFGE